MQNWKGVQARASSHRVGPGGILSQLIFNPLETFEIFLLYIGYSYMAAQASRVLEFILGDETYMYVHD